MKRLHRQAVLILSDRIDKQLLQLYTQVKEVADSLTDVFLLFHKKTEYAASGTNLNIFEFTDDVLYELDYRPITEALIPGSNHFPVLKFFLANPNYDYYWCIEDDVAFTGYWAYFFNEINKAQPCDFLTTGIKHYNEVPNWHWWFSLKSPVQFK